MKALILALFLIPMLPMMAEADVSVPRAKQYAQAVFDVSVLGGATVPGTQNIINLGTVLPAGIVITDAWVYINTAFAATGTESIAIQCAGNQDILNFTSIKNLAADRMLASRMLGNTFNGSSSLIPSSPTSLNFGQGYGSVPATGSTVNGCPVSVEIQGLSSYTPYTSGKLTTIIEYFKL